MISMQVIRREIVACILAVMGSGFAYKYAMSRPNIPEYQFGRVFWNDDRPVHAMIHLVAAWMVWSRSFDIAAGIVAVSPVYSVVRRYVRRMQTY